MGIFSKGETKIKKAMTGTTKKKEGSKIKFFDSMNLWTRVLADLIDKGVTDVPEESLAKDQFYYSTNRIYTQKGVKKMFFLDDLPSEMPRGFVSDIRESVKKVVRNYNMTHTLNEYVNIALVIDGEHYSFDLSDRRVQGRWSYFAKEFERVAKKLEGKTLQDELKSDKYSDSVRRKVNSFLYIKSANEEYNASFFKTKVVLEFIASSNDVLTVAEKELKAFCYRNKVKVKETFLQANEYQKCYTPVSIGRKSLLRKMNEGDVWADDTIASFTVSTHGFVGDKYGVLHGIDIQSKNALSIDWTRGEDVKNILIAAGSGEGKSNYMKMLYTFYTMIPHYATVIFDYEGIDYFYLGKLSGASMVSFGEAEGTYVNTMVIGDLTGDKEIDVGLKVEAQNMTQRVFNILFDEDYGMNPLQESFFSDVLKHSYLAFGVTDDPRTWSNSKNCTFYSVYATARNFVEDAKMIAKYGKDFMREFVNILSKYFDSDSMYTHWFKNPISITEILNTNNLILNFGMATKGEGGAGANTKSLALRQMFASYLTTLVANKNKAKGIFTVVVLEELQRYLRQKFSGEIVAGFCTGGRKLNMIVYCITNAPKELIDLTYSGGFDENVGTTASKIMGNISTVVIGALYKPDMDALIHQFSLENSQSVLYQLSDIKENSTKSGGLKHCFFIRYSGQSTVVKMLSHPALEELPLYRTVRKANGMVSEDDIKLRINDDYEKELRNQVNTVFEKDQQRKKIEQGYDSRKVNLYGQKMLETAFNVNETLDINN